MVSVIVDKNQLFKLANVKLNNAELEDALLSIKCSLEAQNAQTNQITIEVTGDRPDMLSVAGIARSLSGIFEKETGLAKQNYLPAKWKLIADEQALKIRPYIASAIVKNAKLNDSLIAEIFNQQEKVAHTLGRKRTKVSVGAWDIEGLVGPIHFRLADDSETFVPLKSNTTMNMEQTIATHQRGKEYGHLLPNGKYPVLADSKKNIIALIPITNSQHSSITTKTTEFGIDAEGTDFQAVNSALSLMCQDFIDLGFSVEKMTVVMPKQTIQTPDTQIRTMEIPLKYIEKRLGFALTFQTAIDCLKKTRLNAIKKNDNLQVQVPSYRSDFMHQADIVEEIALGYGLNNIKPNKLHTFTKGSLSETTLQENLYRDFFVGAGYLEVSNYVLTNSEINNKAKVQEELIEISNPISSDYHGLRTNLISGLLKTISENTHRSYPQKIFEVGKVVYHEPKLEEKIATGTNACCLSAHSQASLSEICSVLYELSLMKRAKLTLKPFNSPQFIENRACIVEWNGMKIGIAGEIHPQVLTDFKIEMPICTFEIKCII